MPRPWGMQSGGKRAEGEGAVEETGTLESERHEGWS